MSAIYYKPNSTMRQLDLPSGCAISVVLVGREGTRMVVDGREGPWTLNYGSHATLRLEIHPIKYREDTNHGDFYARLWELSEALASGECIHLALDSTKAGLWPLRDSGDVAYGFPAEDDDRVWLGTERTGVEAGISLAEDDLAVIEEEAPSSRLWVSRISSWSGSGPITVDLASACHRDFVGRSWLRHHDFLPYLYRAEAHRSADPFSFMDPGQRVAQWTMELTMRLPEV